MLIKLDFYGNAKWFGASRILKCILCNFKWVIMVILMDFEHQLLLGKSLMVTFTRT